jgi:hypothetical protein
MTPDRMQGSSTTDTDNFVAPTPKYEQSKQPLVEHRKLPSISQGVVYLEILSLNVRPA